MDRIIQPHQGPYGAPPARPVTPTFHANTVTRPPKSSSDYFRALRRRFWLVLFLALFVIIPGAILAVRQPDIYQATATIKIEPPGFNETVASVLPQGGLIARDREAAERYVPNRLSQLRGTWLAEKVIASPSLGLDESVSAFDIVNNLRYQRHAPDSSYFDVFLEGRDPARIQKLLNALLKEFADQGDLEIRGEISKAELWLDEDIRKLTAEFNELEETIVGLLDKAPIFAPNGENLLQKEFIELNSVLSQKRLKFDELLQEERVARLYPSLTNPAAGSNPYEQRIQMLMTERQRLLDHANNLKRTIRRGRYLTDPSSVHVSNELKKIESELAQLQQQNPVPTQADMLADLRIHSSEELHRLNDEVKTLRDQMQESMPAFHRYLGLLRQREMKEQSLMTMQDRRNQFSFLAKTQRVPIEIVQHATEPTAPIRPDRGMNIVLAIVLGLAIGVGVVCLLESLDHRVKVPEHLTAGSVRAAVRRRAPDATAGQSAPGRAPLDARRTGVDRGRCLPQPAGQPAGGLRAEGAADRDLARHQRQGGRGQEHHRLEPGGHLRPRRRANPLDGRGPAAAQPRRGLRRRRA